MMQRNTIQRALVLEAVNRLRDHPTAEEIYAEVAKEHPHISRGTVYRNLQRLCEQGEIRRREAPGGPDRFDHICGDHYHVRCERCGRLFDVDMEYRTDLEAQVRDPHGFLFTGHDIIFRGLCPACRRADGASLPREEDQAGREAVPAKTE